MLLSWPAPLRNAGPGSVQSIRRIDIYRLAEKPDAPLPLTEDDFAARATIIGFLDFAAIKAGQESLTYTDKLTFTGVATRLRYALRYVNDSGQRAAFSNFLLLEPAAKIAQPPVIKAISESELSLTLKWADPSANIDGSTELNITGYNVYRASATGSAAEAELLNGLNPIAGKQFSDKSFNFGEQYSYVVRAVSLGPNGQLIESLNSNSVSVRPIDRYPPAPPANLSVAASPNSKVISLFFPANAERDIAGYRVFRTTEPDTSLDKWQQLTTDLLNRTTFRDEKVSAGKTYYYYLVAVDKFGNTSAPSKIVSEQVPQ